MEHSAFININLLSQEAKKELETFYEFLLFKYKKPRQEKENSGRDKIGKEKNNDSRSENKPFSAISIDTRNFKFDREEANER